MPRNLFSRYIWLLDTIKRYGSISRKQLNELWIKNDISGGEPMARRTFYTYRKAVEELFQINIECNPETFEYYIEHTDAYHESMLDWLLNSAAVSSMLNDTRDISDRIFLEDVPSARQFLPSVVDALKGSKPVRFTYHPYSRINPTPDIVLEPYFLKIFKQRWYITGRNVRENRIKTYALDRMSDLNLMPDSFEMPRDFDPAAYARDSYGIIFNEGEVKNVALRTDPRQAKYFRSVPLHHSQSEMFHDAYSIFTYKLRITPDFVQELLSYGPKITVLSPPELRAMIVNDLRATLANYESQPGEP